MPSFIHKLILPAIYNHVILYQIYIQHECDACDRSISMNCLALKLESTRYYKEIDTRALTRLMSTSRPNENRHSAKQSTQAVDLCWDPLTVKFTRIFSKAVVIEPWPNFVNRFCWNCHNCLLGSQEHKDTIENTPQSRTTSAKEDELCLEQRHHTRVWRSFLGQPLVGKSTWCVTSLPSRSLWSQ